MEKKTDRPPAADPPQALFPKGFKESGYLKAMPEYTIKVYNALLLYRNVKNSSAWPSLKTLSEITGYPMNKITRATNWLDKWGLISKRKGPKETGFASIYAIKMNLKKDPQLENLKPPTVQRWTKGGPKSQFLKKDPPTVQRWIKDTEKKKTQTGTPEDESPLYSPSSGGNLSPSSGDTELKEKEVKAVEEKNDGIVLKERDQFTISVETEKALKEVLGEKKYSALKKETGHSTEQMPPIRKPKKPKTSPMKKPKKTKTGLKPHQRTTAMKELGELEDPEDQSSKKAKIKKAKWRYPE